MVHPNIIVSFRFSEPNILSIQGPEFLYKFEPEWPQDQLTTETDEPALSELVKNPPETTHVLTTSEEHSTEISLPNYQLPTIQQSSLSVSSKFAYVLRFVS